MKYAFTGATGDGTSPVLTRSASKLASFLVDGRLKWNNTGTGTASLSLIDNFTGVVVATGSVAASSGGQSDKFDIPFQYVVEISGTTGSIALDVAIDGDA